MPEYTAGRARILLEPTARGFYTKSRTAIKDAVGAKGLHVDVRLNPVADGFATAAERKIKETHDLTKRVDLKPILAPTFRTSTRDQVKTALAGLNLNVHLNATVDFTKANNQIHAWRRRQEAVPLRIQVLPQQGGIGGVTTGAGSANWRARNLAGRGGASAGGGQSVPGSAGFVPQVNAQQFQRSLVAAVVQGVAAAQKSAPQVKVQGKVALNNSVAQQDMRRQVAQLQRDFQDNFRLRIQPTFAGVQLRLPLGSLGTQVIPAAVAAIGSLISSIQQLSQAGLALPGALSVAGASLGSFAFNLGGISDAWKALGAEQERAAGQATTDAARMQSAYNQVRNSSVDVTRAQKDLTDARKDARRALEDLHNEERSNNLSVAESVVNLQRARNELRAGNFATPLDRQDAVLRELRAQEQVDQALLRQKRTREDVNDEAQKGVEGSDAVVQAQENLTRAIQSQTEALTAYQMESSGAANAADKVKAAMEELGPETAAVVNELWRQREAFQDLRRVSAGNMFRDFSNEIAALSNASLPLLYRRLGGMGTVWNETLRTITGNLRSTGTQSIVDRIFGNTEETQRRLNRAIDPIIRGMGTLAAAGSDAMPRLANAITDVASRFADFIVRADDEGRLAQWIDTGMESFATLGRIIGQVGGAINGITRAFGGSFLTNMEGLVTKLNRFLNSSQGQEDLRVFISNVREDFEAWRPILEDLPRIFGAAMEAARAAIQTVLPLINLFTEVLEKCPGLIGAVVTAFLGWSAIKPVVTAAQVGATGLATALTQVGTGFATTRDKARDAAKGIDDTFAGVGKQGSGVSKAAKAISGVGFALGVGGPLMAGIAVAATALLSLIDTHDDAAEAADRQATATARIADALDRVTVSAGAASRAQIAQEMQDFKPDDQRAMGGDVEAALNQLGINPSNAITAVMPGGGTVRSSINNQLADQVRQTVIDSIPVGAKGLLAGKGVTEEDVVRAFLGDADAKARFEAAANEIKNTNVRGVQNAFQDFNLGDVRTAVEAAGGAVAAAGLAGQYINSRAPQVQNQQNRGQSAQRNASGINPVLSADGSRYFASNSPDSIGYDATTNQYGLVAYNLSQPQIDNLKARNNIVDAGYPTGQGMAYRIIFSEADAKTLLSYAAGGPTPSGKGTGPTGGHIVEVHDEEWVLPKHVRRAIGDERLWALTGGNRTRKRSGFYVGGPGNLATDLPPVIPPVPDPVIGAAGTGAGPLPGPATVPSIEATPQTGFQNHLGNTNQPTDVLAGVGPQSPATMPGAAVGGQQPDIGSQMLNAWFPWLGTVQGAMADPNAAAALGTGDPSFDPLSYLGQWGGNFLASMGNTLLGGVMSFFGLDLSTYMNAMQRVVGFYGNKFGPMLMNGGAGGGLDSDLQGYYDAGVAGYSDYPTAYADGGGIATTLPGINAANRLANTATVGKPFEGSGVVAAGSPSDQAKIDASRAPNASVIPDANIVAYIRQQAAKYGLTMGDEGKEGGNPYRTSESASLHTIGMAGDLFGTPEQRRAFLEAWHQDPILRDATRMIIDDNNTDLEMYAGQNSGGGVYGRGQHGDHIHLGLEGVPGYNLNGMILQRDVGGGSTVVPGSNAGAAGRPGWNFGQPAAAAPRSGPAPTLGGFIGGGGGGGGYSSPSTAGGPSGMPPLQYPGSVPSGASTPGPAPRAPGTRPAAPGGRGLREFFPPGFLPPTTPGRPQGLRQPGAMGGPGRVAMPGAMGGRVSPGIAPKANYAGGNQQTWDAVYKAFLQAGFHPNEWGALVNLLNGESGWRPTVANPSSGAFGLFQFLGATQRAYLPDKNPDPYIQGLAGMKYIKDRYGTPSKAWSFWQSQSPHWYDRSGILPRGASVVVNQKDEDEVIIGRRDAQQAKKMIERAKQMDPRMGGTGGTGGPVVPPGAIPPTTKKPGPPLTPDVDIPRALPAPGISGPAAPTPQRQVAGAAPESNTYVLPALAKGIQSGAATLGSLASTAISAAAAGGSMGASAAAGGMGAGQAGQLVSGLFQQGGKIGVGIANVVSAALTGLTKTGTTENPYGITLRNNQPPPPLAQDNRRVHNGDNNFASMDEWRRQTQIQDAHDMQTSMTRMKV